MGSPLTDKQFVRLLDDRLSKVYYDQYKALPLYEISFITLKDLKKHGRSSSL